MTRLPLIGFVLAALFLAGCESNPTDGTKETHALPPPVAPEKRQGDIVYAYMDSVRSGLSDGKVQIINRVMRLTPEESKVFWPIYHDYEDELFSLGDRRVELTRMFVDAQAAGRLDDAKATTITDGWFEYESQRLALLQKYQKQIAKELSPIRAAQFTPIEHRVGSAIDVILASELPLVQNTRASVK